MRCGLPAKSWSRRIKADDFVADFEVVDDRLGFTPASNKTHPFRLVLAEISQLSDRGGKRRIFLFGMHPRSTVTHKLSTAITAGVSTCAKQLWRCASAGRGSLDGPRSDEGAWKAISSGSPSRCQKMP
jgi:hypothetical protein